MTRPVAARRAVLVVFFVQGTCFAALLSRIPALQQRFGLGHGQLALLLAVVPVIAGAASIAAGALSHRYGSAPVLRIAAPMVCASLAGVGAVTSLTLLLAMLVVFGCSVGAVDATMNMRGVDVQRAYGRNLMSSFHGAFSLGSILGSLAGAAAAMVNVPLFALFASVALLGVLGLLAAGPFLSLPRLPAPSPDPWSTAPAGRLGRRILVLGTIVTCLFIVDSSVANWSAVYLRGPLDGPESVAALGYGCYAVATLLGRSVADALVERLGPSTVVQVGGLLATTGLTVVVIAHAPLPGLIGFALLGLGLSSVVPQAFTAAAHAVPNSPDIAVARVNAFTYAGFVLGAPLVGIAAEIHSLRGGFVIVLLLTLFIVASAPAFATTAGPPAAPRAPR